MDTAEYISVLKSIIGLLVAIIGALGWALWRHVVEDRKARVELQRCKDALGLNGSER